MKTLYIDVYFLINFTVDILAIFIALKFVHAKISISRLVLSGIIGALWAIIELFVDNMILHIILAASFVMIISVSCCKNLSFRRSIKFIICFYIASFLISGAVNFAYSLMDEYIYSFFTDHSSTTNRKALIFSLIILLIMGVLRLFIMMFSEYLNERSTRILIKLEDKTLEIDALIDTGNLVRDPMNMNPVIFIKKECAEHFFPASITELSNIDSLSQSYRKRIRLIPVTRNSETHVMIGVRVDKIIICNEKSREEIDATIVIDKEEGTFGGYYALVPYVQGAQK